MASALDVAELVAEDGHRNIGHLDAAGQAFPSLLLVHMHNLALASPAFHRLSIIPIRP
jgi:hypothetical protein